MCVCVCVRLKLVGVRQCKISCLVEQDEEGNTRKANKRDNEGNVRQGKTQGWFVRDHATRARATQQGCCEHEVNLTPGAWYGYIQDEKNTKTATTHTDLFFSTRIDIEQRTNVNCITRDQRDRISQKAALSVCHAGENLAAPACVRPSRLRPATGSCVGASAPATAVLYGRI